MLKCVPFNHEWASSSADMRAIYERRRQDNWGNPILDADGREQWDATGPLPVRRHHDWEKKGFRYVTLADEESLAKASHWLRQQGLDPAAYLQDRRTRSPFNLDLYLSGREQRESDEREEWRRIVTKYGPDAAADIRGPLPTWLTKELSLPEPEPVAKKPSGRPRKAEATA